MGFLDSILGGQSKEGDGMGGTNALIGALGGLLTQSGGLQGLVNKFTQAGHGDKVSSWIGTGENQPISGDQVQHVIGPDQVRAMAAKLGIDPTQASQLLAQYLPKIVDQLTPAGRIDPSADHSPGLASLLPSLLQSLGGGTFGQTQQTGPAEEESPAR